MYIAKALLDLFLACNVLKRSSLTYTLCFKYSLGKKFYMQLSSGGKRKLVISVVGHIATSC